MEKSQISLGTLIMALFYDVSTKKDFKIPTQPERRERALRDLIKRRQKTIALFIDDVALHLNSRQWPFTAFKSWIA